LERFVQLKHVQQNTEICGYHDEHVELVPGGDEVLVAESTELDDHLEIENDCEHVVGIVKH